MLDAVIRMGSGLLLIALQTAEGVPAVPSPLTDCIPVETDSVDYNSPYKMEQSGESNGSLAAAAPMVVGQPATVTAGVASPFAKETAAAAAATAAGVETGNTISAEGNDLLLRIANAVEALGGDLGTTTSSFIGSGRAFSLSSVG